MDISIVIVNWNTKDLLLACISSIFDTIKELTFEIWLVDNASTDGSVEAAKKGCPDIHIIKNQMNLGFAAANNLAFERMKGRYALLLNTDTTLTDGAAQELYNFMEENPGVGMACGQLLNADGTKQNSIANFPSLLSLLTNESLLRFLFPKKYPGKRYTYDTAIEVESCIGACMIIRKKAMADVGLFDEDYFFFLEETDWACRMRKAGWKIYFVPSAKIFHAQGMSIGKSVTSRKLYYRSLYTYFKKWHKYLWPLSHTVIFLRLLVNTVLTMFGVIFTLGSNTDLNKKLSIYFQLIAWHFKGCPPETTS